MLSDSASGAAAAWSHSFFSWASQDQCYTPPPGWSETGSVLGLKEQVCSYFKTWRIEAPSGNTSMCILTAVGCGLSGGGLLLFPLRQADELGWAWNWVCGANWELQDSDSPVSSRWDPIFSVSFFSGSTCTSNKGCPFEVEMFAVFCVLLPAPYEICLRSLRTSVIRQFEDSRAWQIPGTQPPHSTAHLHLQSCP